MLPSAVGAGVDDAKASDTSSIALTSSLQCLGSPASSYRGAQGRQDQHVGRERASGHVQLALP
eukprot:115345-Karenia_brevis.AAC.1